MKIKRPAALAVASLFVLPAAHAAASTTTTTLAYKCGNPALGTFALSATVKTNVEDVWAVGEPTPPVTISADISSTLNASKIPDLRSLGGQAIFFTTVRTAQGFDLPAKTTALLGSRNVATPGEQLTLSGTAKTPPLFFEEPGVSKLTLTTFALNLRAINSDGSSIVVRGPDVDGGPAVVDSDGDPGTFDVSCALDPVGQDRQLATFEIADVDRLTGGSAPLTCEVYPFGGSGTAGTLKFASGIVPRYRTGQPFNLTGRATATFPNMPRVFDGISRVEGKLIASLSLLPIGGGPAVPATGEFTVDSTKFEVSTLVLEGSGRFDGGALVAAGDYVLRLDAARYELIGSGGTWQIPPTPYAAPCDIGSGSTDLGRVTVIDGVEPTPTPTPASVPAIPGNATVEPFLCKWPLIGTRPADFLAARSEVVRPGGAPRIGIWLRTDLRGPSGPVADPSKSLVGTIKVTLASGGASVTKVAVVASSANVNNEAQAPLLVYAVVDLEPGDLPLPISDVRVVAAAPNLTRLIDGGEPLALPPLTKDVDGNPTTDSDGDPNSFDVSCRRAATPTPTPTPTPQPSPTGLVTPKPTPPGQTPTPTPIPTATPTPTATPVPTTPVTAKLSYSLQGSTSVNTLTKGSMPLTGGVDATVVVSTGDVTADLKLNDTQGRLVALQFLPVTVSLGFVTSGPTTGKLVDDQLTTNSRVRIKLKSAKAFGIVPLVAGNNCQTKSLSDVTLKSTTPFDPTGTGGTLAGTYAISDLNGCGPFQGLVSPLTAGGGNTISVKLTPKP